MKKTIAAGLLCRTGVRSLLHHTVRWSGILGLNYHRIGNGSESVYDRGLWSADEDAFAAQIRFCKTQLDVITPADLPHVLSRKRGRYALITFDDGYRDNYEVAFPVLRREGVSATFFVASGFIDAPKLPWWDELAWMVRTSTLGALELPDWFAEAVPFDEPSREAAIWLLLRKYKAMPAETTGDYLNAVASAAGTGRCAPQAVENVWMTWDMLREMKAAGMSIGGHTVNHPVLARLPPDGQQQEITECGKRLATELGEPMRYFSYPVGNRTSFDSVTRESLHQAAASYGFSYYGGYRRFDDWDDYDIRRVGIEADTNMDLFRSIVSMPQIFA